MKKLLLLCVVAFLAASLAGQSPPPGEAPPVQALMKDVQAQQLQLADNQAKIDAKLATVAEALRVARIYASRGGH